MQFKHVTLDFDGPVAILKLDHQEVMNAVSMDMLGGLGEAHETGAPSRTAAAIVFASRSMSALPRCSVSATSRASPYSG